jgi:predicted O-methyltransferase YrrM
MTDGDLLDRIEAMRAEALGWCWPAKARRLAETVLADRPAACVEIGVFGGSSLVHQAAAVRHLGAGRVYGIDPWATDAALDGMREPANRDYWSAVDLEAVYQGCRALLARHGLDGVCELVRAKAADVVGRFADGSVGLLHIDGNHGEERSTQDAELYLPKVAIGGVIFFDDVTWAEQGVLTTQRALTHLLANGCRVIDHVGNCAILRRVGPPAGSAAAGAARHVV